METILNINSLAKTFNGVKAVADFSCALQRGKIVGLIGPNGAGKTTVFNLITGFVPPDSGEVFLLGKDVTNAQCHRLVSAGISRTFQDLRLIREMRALDNVLLGFQNQPGESLFSLFFNLRAVTRTENLNTEKAEELLRFAGIEEKRNDFAGNLSYGQQKLLSIVCALAADPKVLLLDEPVSGIQPEMIKKIVSMLTSLKESGKSIFVIEHDMDFISSVADRIIVMDQGRIIADGSPNDIKGNKEILEAYLE